MTRSKAILIPVIVLCSISTAFGWLRQHVADAVIVSRAELIVVGHIQENSLVRIRHTNEIYGSSWEHYANLEITDVLKGQVSSNLMAVSIHYGLDPIAGRKGFRTNAINDSVEIWDTGNSIQTGFPISGDIRTNHIWFLHRVQKLVSDSDWIGIYDPEDIQPIARKDELLKHLK